MVANRYIFPYPPICEVLLQKCLFSLSDCLRPKLAMKTYLLAMFYPVKSLTTP